MLVFGGVFSESRRLIISRAVDSSVIRTLSSPARMAPMLGRAFCGPPLTPILLGMRRRDSNSRAIVRSLRSRRTSSPFCEKYAPEMSPMAPWSRMHSRSASFR